MNTTGFDDLDYEQNCSGYGNQAEVQTLRRGHRRHSVRDIKRIAPLGRRKQQENRVSAFSSCVLACAVRHLSGCPCPAFAVFAAIRVVPQKSVHWPRGSGPQDNDQESRAAYPSCGYPDPRVNCGARYSFGHPNDFLSPLAAHRRWSAAGHVMLS